MDSYCSIFNYPLGVIIISFSDTYVSIIDSAAETRLFPRLVITGENILSRYHVTSVCKF